MRSLESNSWLSRREFLEIAAAGIAASDIALVFGTGVLIGSS